MTGTAHATGWQHPSEAEKTAVCGQIFLLSQQMDTAADKTYMQRCLHLAALGKRNAKPNPMVGALLVHNSRIIAAGWHRQYGSAHAEIDCLESVAPEERHVIPESTLYVNLEPCAHHGKTPPCAERIVAEQIRRVVIANRDPYKAVSGKGIEILKNAGIDVQLGPGSQEGLWLNRRFFCTHHQGRPYVILKWAQTKSGIFAPPDKKRRMLSNAHSRQLVHKWRTEEGAIMVGTDTARYDNPGLTARYWDGPQPLRIVADRALRLSPSLDLYKDNGAEVWIVNDQKEARQKHLHYIQMTGERTPEALLQRLKAAGIISVIIEGGATLLRHFIETGLWDEARIFYTPDVLGQGVPAPVLQQASCFMETAVGSDLLCCYTAHHNAYPHVPGMEL